MVVGRALPLLQTRVAGCSFSRRCLFCQSVCEPVGSPVNGGEASAALQFGSDLLKRQMRGNPFQPSTRDEVAAIELAANASPDSGEELPRG